MRVRTIVLVVALLEGIGCEASPEPLPATAPVLSVCEAAQQPVGARIVVRGEFGGVSLNVAHISLHSESKKEDLCNERGAGMVFADLAHAADRERYSMRSRCPLRTLTRPALPWFMAAVSAITAASRTGQA
jgi:hypothetical protein